MTAASLAGVAACLLYSFASVHLLKRLAQRASVSKLFFVGGGALALILHAYAVAALVATPEGVNLGFFNIGAVIGWLIALLAVVTSLVRPVQNVVALSYPTALLALACALALPSSYTPRPSLSPGLAGHILVSVLAYSLLAIAAGQALALALQDHDLKRHYNARLLSFLPPLETMEQILFEILWLGLFFLTLAIVTGFAFLENVLAQHQAHIIAFSIAAWLCFAVLLAGRHALGWRGRTAIRGTLIGFSLLMVGFFGSRLVVEWFLPTA